MLNQIHRATNASRSIKYSIIAAIVISLSGPSQALAINEGSTAKMRTKLIKRLQPVIDQDVVKREIQSTNIAGFTRAAIQKKAALWKPSGNTSKTAQSLKRSACSKHLQTFVNKNAYAIGALIVGGLGQLTCMSQTPGFYDYWEHDGFKHLRGSNDKIVTAKPESKEGYITATVPIRSVSGGLEGALIVTIDPKKL